MKNPMSLLFLFVLLAMPLAGALAETDPDEVIESGDIRSTATMLGGQFIRMAGQVPDFMGAGRTVDITGTVTDNALAFGQEITLDGGSIDGDFLAMGQTVEVDGLISGDVFVGCEEFRLSEGGVILGNLYFGASRLILDGRVEGTLHGGAERIILEGQIGGGEVELGESGSMEIGSAARIMGELCYTAPIEAEIPVGAEILGALNFTLYQSGFDDDDDGFSLLKFLWYLVAAMIVGLVLLAIAGPWMRASASSLSESSAMAFAWGALFLFATPLALALVMVTVVGIPLALLGGAAYAAALYLAPLPLALWLGDWLLRKMGRVAPGAFLSLSLGLLIYKILASIPWLGYLMILVALLMGMGAMFLGCRNMQAKLKT
jgi:hypothetical protein